jgi:hypothetical protein
MEADNDQGYGRSYQVELPEGCSLPFRMQFGLPRPDWETFRGIAEQQPDPDSVWRSSVGAWLSELATALKPPYRSVLEGEVMLLSGRDDAATALLVRQCAYLKSEVARLFARLVSFEGPSVDIVLVFNRGEQYASYVAEFFEDGQYAGSGGMYISSTGIRHIALLWDRWEWHRTLAHELAHVVLADRELPLWLEEGLVALVEQELVPQELVYGKLAPRQLLETRRFWRTHDLALFWSGAAFFDVEAQEHAYRLAEVMIRNLSDRYGKRFGTFVESATREDHGEVAATATFGITLRDCASQFLGDPE